MSTLGQAITAWRTTRHINKAEELEEQAQTAPNVELKKNARRFARAERHLRTALKLAGDNSDLRSNVLTIALYLSRSSYALPNQQQSFMAIARTATSREGELETYCALEFERLTNDNYTSIGIERSINSMKDLIGDDDTKRRKLLVDLTKMAAGMTDYPASPHLFPRVLAAAKDVHEAAHLVTLTPEIPTAMVQTRYAFGNAWADIIDRDTNFATNWHLKFAQAGKDPVCKQAADGLTRAVITHLTAGERPLDASNIATTLNKGLLGNACNIARHDPLFRTQLATLCVDAIPLVASESAKRAMRLLHIANTLCQRPMSAIAELTAHNLRISPELAEYGRMFMQKGETGKLIAYAVNPVPDYKTLAVTATFGTPTSAEMRLIDELREGHRFVAAPPACSLRESWITLCRNHGTANPDMLASMAQQPLPSWAPRRNVPTTDLAAA